MGPGETVVVDAIGADPAALVAYLNANESTTTVVVTDAPVMHDVRDRPQKIEFMPTAGVSVEFAGARLEEIVRVYGAGRVVPFPSSTDQVR